MRQILFSIMLTLLLSACARPVEGPADTQPLAPLVTVRGERLPGRLLFVRNGVIWAWEGQTGQPLFGAGQAWQPVASPDGSRIAYIERANSSSDLVLTDRDGHELQRLTSNGSSAAPNSLDRAYTSRWAFYPTWLPNGLELIFAGQAAPPTGDPAAEYNLSLYQLATAGGSDQALYANNEAHCGRTAAAPGEPALIVACTTIGTEGQQQLYRLLLTTGSAEPLSEAPSPSYDPAFSADGMWLAFAARSDERTDIFALPSTGQGAAAQRLTTIGSARAPAFSPEGQHLAFLALSPGGGFDLWVADLSRNTVGQLSASNPRQLTTELKLDADSGISWGK